MWQVFTRWSVGTWTFPTLSGITWTPSGISIGFVTLRDAADGTGVFFTLGGLGGGVNGIFGVPKIVDRGGVVSGISDTLYCYIAVFFFGPSTFSDFFVVLHHKKLPKTFWVLLIVYPLRPSIGIHVWSWWWHLSTLLLLQLLYPLLNFPELARNEEKINCILNPFSSCFWRYNAITSIVFHCWSKVPTFYSMYHPCSPCMTFLMNKYLNTWWCYRMCIVIMLAMKLCIRWKIWINPWLAQLV